MEEGNRILFDTWAESWQQGCLLGNGFMGQVIYGRPGEEIVELSHGAFFSGSGNVDPYPEKGAEAFAASRKAALEGDYEEIYRQTGRLMGKRGNYGTNLPVGKLHIGIEGQSPVSDYRRYLDLDRGIAGCSYGNVRNRHLREALTSHEDHVFACRMEQTGAEMTITVSFDGGRNPYRTWAGDDGILCFETAALETVHSDGTEGSRLYGAVKLCAADSRGEQICPEKFSLKEESFGIRVCGAKCVVLYLSMDVWTNENGTEEAKKAENVREAVMRCVCRGLEEYSGLRERHSADIGALMGRQRLKLGQWREEVWELREEQSRKAEQDGNQEQNCGKGQKEAIAELSAGELLDQVRQGGDNRRLTELMYQYGRYLLLSSSRQDSPMPAHLQGVWNDDVACRIGWTCDMHLDINTQMNYWISEPGHLSECHEPLFDWMEKHLIPNGRLTARKCYGYSGWVGELVSNAWGYAAPYWNESLSPCPTGGIWQASDYMEHYRYGQDRDFLRKRVLPVIGEAVSFFLEYLFEDRDGYLVGGPSISPENAFWVNGKKYFASTGCTYEMVMIRELFLQYTEICRELGIGEGQGGEPGTERSRGYELRAEQDGECRLGSKREKEGNLRTKQDREWERCAEQEKESVSEAEGEKGCELRTGQGQDWEEMLCQVERALPRLLPYRILPDGTLAEWNHDYEAADLQHRHTSHLLGLFPYGQITTEGTPALAKAAAASIKAKLTPCENWEDTGWARSLLALYSARLGDANQAYRHLVSMQTILTGGNLLVMHPPTRGAGSFMEVYELDGNTGFSMAVMEMLIQSHENCIRLLPALPKMWPEGKLEGAAVRGGILLDLYWEQGTPVKITLLSGTDRKVTLRYADTVRKYTLRAGQKIDIRWHCDCS